MSSMSNRQRMWLLASTFPTLREWVDRMGPEDIDGDAILAALREPWVTTGSRYALLFLADVWNSSMRGSFTAKASRRDGPTEGLLPRELRTWSIVDAFASWDDAHRSAALAWFRSPWWP
jgi:hypothetical protein